LLHIPGFIEFDIGDWQTAAHDDQRHHNHGAQAQNPHDKREYHPAGQPNGEELFGFQRHISQIQFVGQALEPAGVAFRYQLCQQSAAIFFALRRFFLEGVFIRFQKAFQTAGLGGASSPSKAPRSQAARNDVMEAKQASVSLSMAKTSLSYQSVKGPGGPYVLNQFSETAIPFPLIFSIQWGLMPVAQKCP
jgi:hypothetical protein